MFFACSCIEILTGINSANSLTFLFVTLSLNQVFVIILAALFCTICIFIACVLLTVCNTTGRYTNMILISDKYNILLFYGDKSINLYYMLSLLLDKLILFNACRENPDLVIVVPSTLPIFANS